LAKYGLKASSGGGRASARETIGRVAAGAIAEKYLKQCFGVEIVAFVSGVGKIGLPFDDGEDIVGKELLKLVKDVTREEIDQELTRCPHKETSQKMTDVSLGSAMSLSHYKIRLQTADNQAIRAAKAADDSLGGAVTCVIRNCPLGLGEPCFDKFEAVLAHAMLSIPSTKGFEIGSGFRGTTFPGSTHNDPFVEGKDGKLRTATNWSGGVQGGITNGEDIYFRSVILT
jgi:chorismate synthase